MEREISGSFQTLIANTSSLPMTKLASCGFVADEVSLFGADGEGCDAAAFVADAACPMATLERASPIEATNNAFLIAVPRMP
jgi:hypothetical protein